MLTLIQSEESRSAWAPPAAKALDEVVWQTWIADGRARDRRNSAARITAVKWASIAGLFAAAGLGSRLVPFEVVVRFVVAASGMVVMFQAFQTRHYSNAVVFGALA